MTNNSISMAIVGRQPLMRLGIIDAVDFAELNYSAIEVSSLVELLDIHNPNKKLDIIVLFKHVCDTELYSDLVCFLSKVDCSKTTIIVMSDVLGRRDWDCIDRGIVNIFLPMKIETGLASYLIGFSLIQSSITVAECRKWTSLLSNKFAPDIRDLSKKELKIMSYLQYGTCNKIIAYELNIGLSTVKHHLTIIYEKLNIGNRTNTALEANRQLSVIPNMF
jgi:DNA-binding NarL/FixJ family response regulator